MLCLQLQAEKTFEDAMAFLDSNLGNNIGRGPAGQGHNMHSERTACIQPGASFFSTSLQLYDPSARQPIGPSTSVSTAVTTTDIGCAAESQVSQRQHRKRATLDAETVIGIFSMRNDASPANCNTWASRGGVTPKAVRDVWNLRTWKR